MQRVQRTNWKKRQLVRPSTRIYDAMRRLSRDRYLCPKEVRELSFAIASRIGMAAGPRGVALKHAFSDWCDVYGMVRGEPPINHQAYESHDYARLMLGKAVEKLGSLKPRQPIKNELTLMDVILEIEKWKVKPR